MKTFGLLVVLVALLLTVSVGLAQDLQSGLEIRNPAEVSELFGEVAILGTASVPGMVYYYLEVHPLNDDLTIPDESPWLPVTVAIEQPVINGVLANVDFTTIDDGLYSLRLTVNTADGQSYHTEVTPLRVSNAKFADLLGGDDEEEVAVHLPLQPGDAPADTAPTVVSFQPGQVSPNVRRCDLVDNDRCPIVDHLDRSESALITAVSANGTGWYKIRLNSGHEGWISPTVVTTSGDLSTLPREAPPAPLPPRPVAPQQPPQSGQAPVNVSTVAFPNAITVQGDTPRCNESFNVQVNITNQTGGVAAGSTLSVQDVNIRTGEITATNYGSFPNINPGGNYVVVIPITTSTYYNENHELRARAGGQEVRLQYTLQQGDCNRQGGSGHDSGRDDDDDRDDDILRGCTLSSDIGTFEGYDRPGGEFVTLIETPSIAGELRQDAAGATWYRVTYIDTFLWTPVVPYVSTSGCN